jgi:hypothetical protein
MSPKRDAAPASTASSKRFATSMRRAMPRNSSLIFQSAVGILTFVLAV